MVESLGNQIQSASNEKYEVDLKVTQKSNEYDDLESECIEAKHDYDADTQKR